MGRLEEGGFVKESSTLAGPQQPAKRGHVDRAALHCNCGLWGKGEGVGSDTRSREPGLQGAGDRGLSLDVEGKPQGPLWGEGRHRGRGPRHPHRTAVTPDQFQPPAM